MDRRHRGAAVVAAIVILVIINLVIVGMVLSGARAHDLTTRRVETIQSFYAAEAGVNMALRELKFEADQDGDCRIGTISNDADDATDPALGQAQFVVTTSVVGTRTKVASYGRSGNSRRHALAEVFKPEIVFDDKSTAVTGTSTSFSFSHTIGNGDKRLFVVCVATEDNDGQYDVTNVTYNTVAMTPAVENSVGSSNRVNCEIWYMLDASLPSAGTYQVTVTTAGADKLAAGGISVAGAAQQAPEATQFNDDGSNGDTSITTQITTVTDSAWIFECIGSGTANAGFTPDSGQDERFDLAPPSSRMAGSTQEITTAATVNQSWSTNSSNRLSHVLAVFAPGS